MNCILDISNSSMLNFLNLLITSFYFLKIHADIFRHGWMEGERTSKCDKMLRVGEWVNLIEVYIRVHYEKSCTFSWA